MKDITPKHFEVVPSRDKLVASDTSEGLASTVGGFGGTPTRAIDRVIDNDGTINSDVLSQDVNVNFVVKLSNATIVTGDGTIGVAIPTSLNGMNLTAALARIYTLGSSGTTTIQVRRRRGATSADMLSTGITVSYNEYYAADGVINTSNDDVATGDMIFIDVDTVASGSPKGLSVILTFE